MTGVYEINRQNLPWKAVLRPEIEGRTAGSFGLGYRPPSTAVRLALQKQINISGFDPPPAYDARDVYAGQPSCRAFEVQDQGSCGSCYAFASAAAFGARLCRALGAASPIGNVMLSPQEMIDCTNGCDGGNAIDVYSAMVRKPGVEYWCDPYTQKKGTCGAACNNGLRYTAREGSVRTVGGVGAAGVRRMQLELMRGGPGVASFDVYDDFYAYGSGIYARSATAKKVGAHAVALIGWGEHPPLWELNAASASLGAQMQELRFFPIS
jgi:cathepsin B